MFNKDGIEYCDECKVIMVFHKCSSTTCPRYEKKNPFDKKKWMKEYSKKNRKKMNAYARNYYKSNRIKHIALVQKWKETHPEKIEEYKQESLSPEGKARRKKAVQKYREKNREHWKKYQREWDTKNKAKKLNSKIII